MKPPLITRKGWTEFHFPRWPKFDDWLTKNEWGLFVGLVFGVLGTLVAQEMFK